MPNGDTGPVLERKPSHLDEEFADPISASSCIGDEFDTVARSNYESEHSAAATPEPVNHPAGQVSALAFCGQVCLGIFLFFLLIWMFSQMGGGGGFYTSGPGSWGGGSWGGGGVGGFPTRGFPSGRGSSGPRMRGGGGSGRSGRAN